MKSILPKPPSGNTFYRYTSKPFPHWYISAKGKQWIDECGLLMKAAVRRRKPIKEQIEVCADLYTCRHQDLDNILKPTLDMLTKAGIIEDDVLVTSLVLNKYKVKHLKEERLEIEIL